MYGYAGNIGIIDLTKKKTNIIETPKKLRKNYIGGRGFTSRLLFENVASSSNPLGPNNSIIIATGPLTGTICPSSGRLTISAKSPLTEILGDANTGGHIAPELKYAGFDAIIINGISKEPCFINVEDNNIEILNAADLWGLKVSDTQNVIKEKVGDAEAHVMSIGPAGENKVYFASIINDSHRAAARCGIGAVFGSKKLKAISIRGTMGLDVNDVELLLQLSKEATDKIYDDPVYPTLSEIGTPFLLDSAHEKGGLATRNFQSGVFEDYDHISQENYTKHFKSHSFACFSCPIHCANISNLRKNGDIIIGGGPEYESIVSLGSKCGIKSLETIIEANNLCNEYGLDTISCGGAISFAMELWEKGIIDQNDTYGLELEWGDESSLLKLIKDISFRKDFGNVLADGVKRAAKRYGKDAERYAIHVKGMEVPAYEARTAKGFALGWAVSTRGADHLRALPNFELLGFSEKEAELRFKSKYASDPYTERGKAYMVFWHENFSAIADSAEICKYAVFSTYAISPSLLSDLIFAATGNRYKDILRVGERIVNLEKTINIRFKGNIKDSLPYRMTDQPMPSGPGKGNVVDLDAMLGEYYSIRGWDKYGVPTPQRLRELRLIDIN